MSDTDDYRTIQSEISTPSSIRRKRTANTGLIGCNNQSHTAFFFVLIKIIQKLHIVKYVNIVVLLEMLIHIVVKEVTHQV